MRRVVESSTTGEEVLSPPSQAVTTPTEEVRACSAPALTAKEKSPTTDRAALSASVSSVGEVHEDNEPNLFDDVSPVAKRHRPSDNSPLESGDGHADGQVSELPPFPVRRLKSVYVPRGVLNGEKEEGQDIEDNLPQSQSHIE